MLLFKLNNISTCAITLLQGFTFLTDYAQDDFIGKWRDVNYFMYMTDYIFSFKLALASEQLIDFERLHLEL